MRRAKPAATTGWAITFADLMGLLVSFFVMLTVLLSQNPKAFEATQQAMKQAFGKNTQQVIVRVPPPIGAENKALEAKLRTLLEKEAVLNSFVISHDKEGLKVEIKKHQLK
jgi:Membrane MotB of proton-channel complex MotA/MotB